MKFQGIIEGSSVGKSHGFAARVSASFQDVFNGVDYVLGKSISALNPEPAGFPSPIPSMADYVAFGKQSRGETSKNTKTGKELADFTSSFLCTPDYVAFEKQSTGKNSMNIKAAKVTMNTKTAKVYPTSIRSTGFGAASSFARIGGILCPLIAVGLVKSCRRALAISLFEVVILLAGIAVLFLPIETKGRALSDIVHSK